MRIKTKALERFVSLESDVTNDANYVHGSVVVGDYIYGSTRSNPGSIVKISIEQPDVFTIFPITFQTTNRVDRMEELVAIGTNLYAIGNCEGYSFLVKFDTLTDTYQVFSLDTIMFCNYNPICTDGIHLYITESYGQYYNDEDEQVWGGTKTYKIKVTSFDGNGQFVTNWKVPNDCLIYDNSSQGGYMTTASNGGYLESDLPTRAKGDLHTCVVDTVNNELYLCFTSASDTEFMDFYGYNATLDKTLFELHVVDIKTMIGDSWCYIPKATDDMAMDDNYIYLGVEIGGNANTKTYGYGATTAAIKKSNLNITMLPGLHATDSNAIASFGLFIIDNKLINIKANGYLFVLDKSNPDNWSLTNPIGSSTINGYNFSFNGVPVDKPINELFIIRNIAYMFIWDYPSSFAAVDITGWQTPSDDELPIKFGDKQITNIYFNNKELTLR